MAAPTGVEEYLAALPDAQRAAMERLRKAIRAAAPEAAEAISYQIPAFKAQGRMLVWYAAFKDHISLYPASEGVKRALGVALEPYFSGKGTIRLPLSKPIPTALVKRVVQARLQENAARG